MTPQAWLKLISLQLGDYQEGDTSQQFVAWPEELLLSYYNAAICFVASIKPADFLQTVTIKLLPGSTQNTCCAMVGAVTEFVSADGKFISNIRSVKKLPTWRGSAYCKDDGAYKPTTTYRTDDAPNSFEIQPPVPATGDYYVKIRCSQPPQVSAATTAMPMCKHQAAIDAYVMFRALSGDGDTALSNQAQLQYKVFTELLGTQNKVEMAFMKAQA